MTFSSSSSSCFRPRIAALALALTSLGGQALAAPAALAAAPSAARSQTAVAAVAGVDHLLFELQDPAPLFQFLSQELGLPVVWPMASYGSFSSGGLSLGNVVLEVGRFGPADRAVPQPHWAGLALRPQGSAADSLQALQRLGLGHGELQPFRMNWGGQERTLWTHLQVLDVAPPSVQLFVCEYAWDVASIARAAGARLQAAEGGPLRLQGVQSLQMRVPDLAQARQRWAQLLTPTAELAPGRFATPSLVGDAGLEISLQQQQAEGPQGMAGLQLRVDDLGRVAQALQARGLAHERLADGSLRLTDARLQGLALSLVAAP